MAKDAFFLKLDANTLEDPKIKVLFKHYGVQGFGQYIVTILKLRNEDKHRLEYCDFTFEALGLDFGCDKVEEVQKFIDDCIKKFNLFKLEDGFFFTERLNRDMARLEEKRELNRTAGRISAEKRGFKPPGNDIAKMIKHYEDTVGKTLTPTDLDKLKDFADNYPEGWFEKALAEHPGKPLSYLGKVMESWKVEEKPVKTSNQGIKTI